jgi:ABC-type glycerol-3-phosphate transport system substrate-binding protein
VRSRRIRTASRSAIVLLVLSLIAAACVGAGEDGGPEPGPTGGAVEPTVAQEPTEPVTIRYYVFSSVAESPQMKGFKREFEAEYPNITVEFEPVPSGRSREKLLTEIAGGNAPDAAFIDAGFVQELASRGALVNLDGYIAGSDVVAREDYVEGFRNTAIFQDSMYGLPFDGETTGLFYRTDLFAEEGIEGPPQTWQEFEQAAAALTDPSQQQYGVAIFSTEAAYYWYPWLWQAGGDTLSSDGQDIAFDSPEGVEAAQFYVNLAQNYAPPDELASDSWNGRVAFATGKVGMYIAGNWFAGQLLSEFPDIEGKWASAPLPVGDAGCATTLAGDSLAILASSEQQDAAWLWIEFLSRPENMTTWTIGEETTTLLPPRESLLQSPQLAENKPFLQGFADDMECAFTSTVEQPKYPEVEAVLNEKLGEAMYGDITPEQALQEAAAEGEQILDEG